MAPFSTTSWFEAFEIEWFSRIALFRRPTASVLQLFQTDRDPRSQSEIVELREAPYPGIALVRPDGYIAYAPDGHDPLFMMTTLHSVLTRQID